MDRYVLLLLLLVALCVCGWWVASVRRGWAATIPVIQRLNLVQFECYTNNETKVSIELCALSPMTTVQMNAMAGIPFFFSERIVCSNCDLFNR